MRPWRARNGVGSKDRIVFFGLSVREDVTCRNKENKCSEGLCSIKYNLTIQFLLKSMTPNSYILSNPVTTFFSIFIFCSTSALRHNVNKMLTRVSIRIEWTLSKCFLKRIPKHLTQGSVALGLIEILTD